MHRPLSSLVVMTICVRSIAAFSARAATGTSTRIGARHSSTTTRTASSSRTVSAFATQQWGGTGTTKQPSKLYSTENGSGDTTSSSFDFDEDERSEQLLADPDRPIPPPPVPTKSGINGVGAIDASKPAGGRYDDLLESVGLTGDDAITSLPSLNPLRPVSTNDVFCNRELRMGGLKAIGFDMDYTLGKLNI